MKFLSERTHHNDRIPLTDAVGIHHSLEFQMPCAKTVICIKVYILAPENEFPEIMYAFFGGRQNMFSTIFGTKFVVICAAKFLKIG